VEDGCLRFVCARGGVLDRGDYRIPFQTVSLIHLGPGSTMSQDALRLLARHGTAPRSSPLARTGCAPTREARCVRSGAATGTLLRGIEGATRVAKQPSEVVSRTVRRIAGTRFRRDQVIPQMNNRIKELFDAE
jgi:hypothetical protein